MPRPPELLKGILFDEAFFDAVIKRAGGVRLTDVHTPPPDTRQVDYILNGFILELKILMTDPLDAPERQAAGMAFLQAKIESGEIQRSADGKVIFSEEQSREFWERILGKSLPNKLAEAADQIRDTLTFLPEARKTGVIIVNSAGHSFDYMSFCRLLDYYHRKIPEIDAVFALHGVPVTIDGHDAMFFATMAKKEHAQEADPLGVLLDETIRAEITHRTKRTPKSTAVESSSPAWRATFQVTSTGIRRKADEKR